MSPDLVTLLEILRRQTDLVADLVEALQGDKQRIVQHDIPALEASNQRKEGLVLRMQSAELERQRVTAALAESLGLPGEDARVSEICSLLGPDGKALDEAATKLRAIVSSLQELVAVSHGFLEQSILGIRSLLGLISSLRTPQSGGYDAYGKVNAALGNEALAFKREV